MSSVSSPPSASSRRFLFAAAFVLGLLAIAWAGVGFVGSSPIALGMTLAIAAVYLTGAQELRRFRSATSGLGDALMQVPPSLQSLDEWLGRVPAPLQNAVRQRVQNGRGALPGLALAPYLIGLLVMLGMLGTFLGMVVTFKGAVFALEGSADLGAIRGALAAPIKGLGLSFGTSVAGVAGSAMLGLMSAMARRERSDVLRQLDRQAATALRPFTAAFLAEQGRDQTLAALQTQAHALPQVVTQLQALVEQVERRHQQLDERLTERQDRFLREAAASHAALGQTVATALVESLSRGAQVAGDSLRPVVENAMAAVAQESSRLHERVGAAVQQQLGELSTRFAASAAGVSAGWHTALQQHERSGTQLIGGLDQTLAQFSERFAARTAELLDGVQQTTTQLHREQAQALARLIETGDRLLEARTASEARWAEQQGERLDALAALWRSELAALREAEGTHLQSLRDEEAVHLQTLRADEAARGQAAVQRLGELQAAVTQQLASLGTALEAPLSRLLETASEAPRAAAEVMGQLRQEMSHLTARDNQALQERTGLVQQISALLQNVQQTTADQRVAIESLVTSAAAVLNQTGAQFTQHLQAQTGQADAQAAQMATSAAALAALGEAFQQGVQQFSRTNEQLIDGLQRVESAMAQSMARSDEQLAYYVAQAREVIDLSISAQQGIVEDMRLLRSARSAAKAPVSTAGAA